MTERINGALWQDETTHDFARGFGARIEAAMQVQGVSSRDLADALGVSYQHVKGWTVGRRLPATPLLPRICEFLNVDAHWLMGLTRSVDTVGSTVANTGDQLEPLLPGAEATAAELEAAGDEVMALARQLWRLAHTRRLHEHPHLDRV